MYPYVYTSCILLSEAKTKFLFLSKKVAIRQKTVPIISLTV